MALPCPAAETFTLPEVEENGTGVSSEAWPQPKLDVVVADKFAPPIATALTECAPLAFGTVTVVDVAACFASMVLAGVDDPSMYTFKVVAARVPDPDVLTVQVRSVPGASAVHDPFACPGQDTVGAAGAVPARLIVVHPDHDDADNPSSSVDLARA